MDTCRQRKRLEDAAFISSCVTFSKYIVHREDMEDLFMMLEVSGESGIETRQSGAINQFSRSINREKEGSYH